MNILKTKLIFLFFSLCCYSAVIKANTLQTITLKLSNVSMKELFSRVEEQTTYSFLYERGTMDGKTTSVDVTDVSIEDLLNRVLPQAGLTYTVKGRQIVITKTEKADKPAAKTTGENYTLRGVIVDSNGEALTGASLLIKGTDVGTLTDFDGKFSLSVTRGYTVLVRYMGYRDQEILITGQNNVKIVMEEDITTLQDVVVVGYGTQKKASVVGSVQTIRPSELKVPATSLSQSFAGRLAGVIAVQRTGEPGADGANFWIRGVATTSGITSPLIILDGVQASMDDLNNIAPEMIESFSVLKDATATALYGTLGANGVMIVTTKSGDTSGKPKINIRLEQAFNTPLKVPSVADGVDYMQLFNEALAYRGGTKRAYSEDKIAYTKAGVDPLVYPNVDWYKEMFNELSTTQTANLNVRGGGAKADYYLGVNASQESGMIKNLSRDYYSFDNNINLKKYVFQNNVNVNLTPSSKISLRLNLQLRDYTGPYKDVPTLFSEVMQSNPVEFPVVWNPDDPRLQDFNRLELVPWGGTSATDGTNPNPVANLTRGVETNFQSTVISTLMFDQKLDFLLPGLSVNALASFKNWSSTSMIRHFNTLTQYYLEEADVQNGELISYRLASGGTPEVPEFKTIGASTGDRTIYLQSQINYNQTFNRVHNVAGMLLYNQQEYNTLADKDHADEKNSGSTLLALLPKRKQGIAGRVTYAYDSKYLLEMNFGYNGSENFAKGSRFGFFPSVAVGYNISQESFWSPLLPVISNLKIRGSYGLVGNDQIGGDRFMYLADVNLQDRSYTTGIEQNTTYSGPSYNRYENKQLTWEVGKKMNVGLDIQLFNSLNIMLDGFREYRTNIFKVRGTIPNFFGTGSTKIYGNLGEVENHGFDLALNYDKQLNKDWFLSLRGTFTFARNTIKNEDEPEFSQYPNKSKVGHQIDQNAMLIAERLFIDQAEIEASPQQTWGQVYPGDIKYTDIADVYGNYNGKIDENDKVYMGYPTVPEIVYGFGASAQYKGFDASIFFQGTGRVSLMMSGFHPFGTSGTRNIYNVLQWVAADRWNPDNPDPYADYPALSVDENKNTTEASTFWYRDASFLKLRNAEVGYTYKNFRLYTRGSNLLTISKFKLWDPEQGGGSGFKYPNQRIINLGLQMNF